MTREAKLLMDMWNTLHKECHKVVTEENYDIIKKAIQALEQEPCEDTVSRKAVLELIESWWLGHTKEDDLATEVKALPPVTPTQRWIPVTERLPEEEQEVLFCVHTGGIYVGYIYMHPLLKFPMADCFIMEGEVVAWMPLPEPYRAESEGKK